MALKYPLVHIDDVAPEAMDEGEGWQISDFWLLIGRQQFPVGLFLLIINLLGQVYAFSLVGFLRRIGFSSCHPPPAMRSTHLLHRQLREAPRCPETLSANICRCQACFARIPDPINTGDFSLSDCLMSALAVFSLKFPSLLQFDRASV